MRQRYFGLFTTQAKLKPKEYSKVELDTTVRLTYNNKAQILHINSESLQTNWIAKKVFGEQKGAFLTIKDDPLGKQTQIHIVDILDKFSGLFAEITEEINNSFKATGYQIRSVKYKTGDIEELNKVFAKEFGADAEKRKILNEESFANYKGGKISFNELVLQVDRNKAFEIYQTLTKDTSKGFIIPPRFVFDSSDFSDISEYVIDITTLPLLVKFFNKDTGNNINLIISQHLLDYLKDKRYEISLLEDNPITLDISLSGVRPNFYPKDYKNSTILEFEKMIKWVEDNCKVDFAPEKLDMLLQEPNLMTNDDWYYHYLLDTLFLAKKENRSLMTDDLLFYKTFRTQTNPINL